jgi:hypothetical protein
LWVKLLIHDPWRAGKGLPEELVESDEKYEGMKIIARNDEFCEFQSIKKHIGKKLLSVSTVLLV